MINLDPPPLNFYTGFRGTNLYKLSKNIDGRKAFTINFNRYLIKILVPLYENKKKYTNANKGESLIQNSLFIPAKLLEI